MRAGPDQILASSPEGQRLLGKREGDDVTIGMGEEVMIGVILKIAPREADL